MKPKPLKALLLIPAVVLGGALVAWAANLSQNDGTSCCGVLVANGAKIFVAWEDNVRGDLNLDVFFRRSLDGAQTFKAKKNVSNNSGDSVNPHFVVQGSNIHLVWADFAVGIGDVFYARSTNAGKGFKAVVNLTDNSTPSIFPRVAASGDNVYVAWQESSGTNADIWFRRSADRGVTFQAAVNVSNNAGLSMFPQILVSKTDGTIYLAWYDETPGNGEIFFTRSTNGGLSFEVAQNLSNNAELSEAFHLASAGSNVYLIWHDFTDFDNTSGDVLFRRSTDSGGTFEATVNLSDTPEGFSQFPQLAVLGTNVHAVWDDDDLGNLEIRYRRSTDGGATFGPAVNISASAGTSINAAIAAVGKRVTIAWEDDTLAGGTDIFAKTSTNLGQKFGSRVNLTGAKTATAKRPRVAVGKVGTTPASFVAWEQVVSAGNRDIMFQRLN